MHFWIWHIQITKPPKICLAARERERDTYGVRTTLFTLVLDVWWWWYSEMPTQTDTIAQPKTYVHRMCNCNKYLSSTMNLCSSRRCVVPFNLMQKDPPRGVLWCCCISFWCSDALITPYHIILLYLLQTHRIKYANLRPLWIVIGREWWGKRKARKLKWNHFHNFHLMNSKREHHVPVPLG